MSGFDNVQKDVKSIGSSVSGLLVTLGGIGAGLMVGSSENANASIDSVLSSIGVQNQLLKEAIVIAAEGFAAGLVTNMYNKAKSKVVKMIFAFFSAALWTAFGIKAFRTFMSLIKGEMALFPTGG